MLLWVDLIDSNNDFYRIATLHHTVTPDGKETEVQTEHTESLLEKLAGFDNLPIMVGDFNIPRGHNINYEKIVDFGYRDGVPASYDCSLDPSHRVWDSQPHIQKYMVDYVWLPAGFVNKDTKLVTGVSDHRALVTWVGKE